MEDTNVNFENEVLVEQRDEHLYVATIMPFHVTGRSNTFEGAIERAREGLDHLLDAYEDDGTLMRFLDESGVDYTLTPN